MSALPVVANPRSGSAPTAERLTELFRNAGAEAVVHLSLDGLDELVRKRPPVIVAAGGDGTVNTVASALVGTDTALAVLPMGTLNHFARDLGVPDDPAAAVEIAVRGKRRAVDVGEVNGRVFVNNASIGLYPAIVRHREKQQRTLGRSKWHAMLWAVLTVLRGHSFMQLTLELDGVVHRRRTPFVFVGNNEYQMEGFTIGLREHLDAGTLSVYVTHRSGRLGLLLLALRALFGRLQQASDFESARVAELRIESRHTRLLLATDGEVAAVDMPLVFRTRPRALQVMAP
ncbi:MAG TPA: diacylglycerol kinase family protein [Burkholderiales bacterium]|nr:diacylglycerol kinase family protein [Burkholderiales bacterium]